jgi:Na+/melibiose symporter-like transporter
MEISHSYNTNTWCHFSVSFKLEISKTEAMINLRFLFFTFFNLNKSVRCSTQVASYLTKILDNSEKTPRNKPFGLICCRNSNENLTFHNIKAWCHFSVSFELDNTKTGAIMNVTVLCLTSLTCKILKNIRQARFIVPKI